MNGQFTEPQSQPGFIQEFIIPKTDTYDRAQKYPKFWRQFFVLLTIKNIPKLMLQRPEYLIWTSSLEYKHYQHSKHCSWEWKLLFRRSFALSSGIHNSQVSTLVLLCKLGDGLVEAVEPGVGGDQHQEGHGDNLHCAGGEKQSIVR